MADKKFERFGKYLILDHLVDGGMAKICRARFLGEQSNKIVAIKMVQPQFSRDPAFVRMFQDELSVTFGLQHPNIAQTYDYGKVSEQLYTAMEYVDGANLKQFLDRLKEKSFVFPVEISVYIISQVCQGLHYAHTFTDKLSGQPLHIVHRDISPHNIMLTYDGAVKVIDFGIAKSNANSEATQAGTIKGKLSYLAPEYLEGLELDARYDEFAVGITLWEMLCSRKLFTAANDLAVLKQIQACKIAPPSSINPNVPKELDAIVMKALSKDRSQRFEDMDKLNRALVKFLYAKYPDFNPSDLSYFAKELFKDEIKRDKEKFVEYGKINVQPYIDEMEKQEKSVPAPEQATADADEASPQRQERREIEMDLTGGEHRPGTKSVTIELAARGSTIGGTKKVARQVATRPGAPTEEKKSSSTSVKTKAPPKSGTRTGKTTIVKNKKDLSGDEAKSVPAGMAALIVAAALTGVVYFQADVFEEFLGFNLQHVIHGQPERSISSVDTEAPKPRKRRAEPIKEGTVSLSGVPLEAEVFVNGARIAYSVGSSIRVPFDASTTLLVKRPGYKTFMKSFVMTIDTPLLQIQVPDMPRANTGLLSSSLNYSSGSVLVFEVEGEKVERKMPFKDMQVPEGKYQGIVKNPLLGTEKEVSFVIEQNKIHLLE